MPDARTAMMRTKSNGFTLIELMIVVAVIALLSAVVLPEVRNYTVRSKVSEALMVMSVCRTSVTEVFQARSESTGADDWGCGENSTTTKYVARLNTTADGAIVVTLQNISAAVDGSTIAMVPLRSPSEAATVADIGTPLFGWSCGTGPTTLGGQYLPSSCRGS
jgi:type IV pilus assembly protein PilA